MIWALCGGLVCRGDVAQVRNLISFSDFRLLDCNDCHTHAHVRERALSVDLETHKAHSQTYSAHSSGSARNGIPQSLGRLRGTVAMTTGYSCQIWSDIKTQ